jgi:hypothetical protein
MLSPESPVRLEALLTKRIDRFFANHVILNSGLRKIVARIEGEQWPAVVFGGMPRDLLVFGLDVRPRDVDIVIADVSLEDISAVFSRSVHRRTRFGGLSLRVDQWKLDVWPLKQTWAFKTLGVSVPSFEDLPKTTFLNAEAIAVDLFKEPRGKRKVYSFGFFESVRRKVIEVNFEPNPFPKLCVVRSLIMAARLGFGIGPRLAAYIAKHSRGLSKREMMSIQIKHYGSVFCEANTIEGWIEQVAQHLDEGSTSPLPLSVSASHERQLKIYETII